MSFKDCIQTAVDSGRISAKKGLEGQDAFDEAYADAIEAGATPEKAQLNAQLKAVEAVSSAKAEKRWQRINEMQKAHKLYTRIMESDNPARALRELSRSMEIAMRRIEGQAGSFLDNFLLKYKPKVTRLGGLIDDGEDIVRAAYGKAPSAEAKQMYDALAAAYEWLRLQANREGASIPENKNRRIPQTHDRLMVRANGGRDGEDWINDHLSALDWDIMRYAGKPIPVSERREVLEKVYWGIVTDGAADSKPAQHSQPALAGRLARDRFLYYKDADSWLAMQKKYSGANVVQQTHGMIAAMARDIATLEHLGPNPNVLKEFAKNTANLRGSELMKAGKGEWTTKVHESIDVFEREYNIFRVHVLNSDENLMAQTVGTIRSFAVIGQLGGAFLSNLNDIMTTKWAFQFHGLPQSGIIRDYMRRFVNGEVSAKQAIRDGVLFESALSMSHSFSRFMGPLDAPVAAHRWSDTVYRSQLATHHNMTIRHVAAGRLQGIWADNAGKRFEELPMATAMARAGITPEDWDIFRATPITVDRGAEFLRPQAIWENPASTAKQKRVADKFADYMNVVMLQGAPERSLRTRVFLKEEIAASSFGGQVLRGGFSLAGFPVEIMFNHMKSIWELPQPKNKLAQTARFVTYLTLGGAFITQVKALAAGDNPYNMNPFEDPATAGEFWLRAFLNGGSGGFIGDFIMQNISIANSQYFGGGSPLREQANATIKLAGAAGGELMERLGWAEEEDRKLGKKASSAALQLVPKIWFMRLLLERGITDDLMRQVDPAAWARKEKYHAEVAPQGRWWDTDGTVQAPNLMTAFGAGMDDQPY